MLAEEGDRMSPSVPSVDRDRDRGLRAIGLASPTYLRTYEQTQTDQDSGDYLAPRNAHEKSADIRDFTPLRDILTDVVEMVGHAYDRTPVIRTSRPGQLDPEVRKAVLMRDRYTCCWCRVSLDTLLDRRGFEVDHIVPWSAGGTNATDNLRTLCAECNQQRSNYRSDLDAARARLIVGKCVRCHGRHYVPARESDDGIPYWRVDEAAVAELGPEHWEVPVWCLNCRAPSATSRAHADDVRARQANRYAVEVRDD